MGLTVAVLILLLLLMAVAILSGRASSSHSRTTNTKEKIPNSREKAEQVLRATVSSISKRAAQGRFQVSPDDSDLTWHLSFEPTPSRQTDPQFVHLIEVPSYRSDRLYMTSHIIYLDRPDDDPWRDTRPTGTSRQTVALLATITRGDMSLPFFVTVRKDGVAEFHLNNKDWTQGRFYPATEDGWRAMLPALEKAIERKTSKAGKAELAPKVVSPAPKVVPPAIGGPLHSARDLDRAGKAADARAAYEEIVRSGPTDERLGAMFSLAFLELVSGNTETAKSLYEEISRSDDPAYARLAQSNLKAMPKGQ